jgi:membrane protease YdiL (CAAX protease family)
MGESIASGGKMKTLIKVMVFYGLTFVFTVILSIVQQAAGIDAGKIVLPQFGPGFAAFAMLALFRGDGLTLAVSFQHLPFRKYLGALGIPILVSGSLFLVYGLLVRPLRVPPIDASSFAIVLAGMLLGAFGEELGWRGYLQKFLDRRLGGLAAFVIVGILWGIWHVGNYGNGPLYMLFFVLSTIGYSAVMAWLLKGTGYNVVLACLFHFAVNAGFYLLKDALTDVRLIAMNGLIWIIFAALVVAVRCKDFLQFRKESADAKP